MFFEWIKRLPRTVGFRLTVWYCAIFILGSVIVFSGAYFLLGHLIDEQTSDSIEFRLHQLSAQYERGGVPAVIELCQLRQGRTQKSYFVRIADANNRTLFTRDADDWSEFHLEELESGPWLGELKEGIAWGFSPGLEGSVLRVATLRMADGNLLQVGRTLEARSELLDRFQILLIAMAGAVTMVGVAGGAVVVYRALRPVHQLTATVGSLLSSGSFNARVTSRGTGDEIDELVQCFNQMLSKIDLLIRGMRDSLDNVAHDLRTPMTRLRNMATDAIEHNYDQARSHEALGDCLEESERVLMMLASLMDIAEAETGVMRLEREPVQVERLVWQVIDLYQHVAEERQIGIEVKVGPELHLAGDAGRLLRALGNLLDNALKYTPSGGKVLFSAERRRGMIAIEVADNGVGIAPEDLARIWERLYRVDKSRSQRGLGLGLSFVKAIVEAHGGQVSVISAPGEGARFILSLPALAGRAEGARPLARTY